MTTALKSVETVAPEVIVPVAGRSLHRKLAQVMYEVDRIPKNGTAPAAMGGFKFVQVGDAADVIRKALAEHNVSMIPSAVDVIGETEHATGTGKMMTTLTVRTTWTLTDGDSGETAVIQSLGAGADMGDKAAPKAQSNAMKYALLMGFLLSTGDDPEGSDSSDRQPHRPAPAAPRPTLAQTAAAQAAAVAPRAPQTAPEPAAAPIPADIPDARPGGLCGSVNKMDGATCGIAADVRHSICKELRDGQIVQTWPKP